MLFISITQSRLTNNREIIGHDPKKKQERKKEENMNVRMCTYVLRLFTLQMKNTTEYKVKRSLYYLQGLADFVPWTTVAVGC